MQKKIYYLKIDETDKFAKQPAEILLSQHEYGGTRFVFSLPPLWSECGCVVSMEYMNRNAPDTRLRTRPLEKDGDGNPFYEVCADFTRTVGAITVQLVGESDDGKVFKTLLRSCPAISVMPAVNALAQEGGGGGNNVLSDIAARLEALTEALAGKADKSDTYNKGDIDGLMGSSEGGNTALSDILAALEQKADKAAVPSIVNNLTSTNAGAALSAAAGARLYSLLISVASTFTLQAGEAKNIFELIGMETKNGQNVKLKITLAQSGVFQIFDSLGDKGYVTVATAQGTSLMELESNDGYWLLSNKGIHINYDFPAGAPREFMVCNAGAAPLTVTLTLV